MSMWDERKIFHLTRKNKGQTASPIVQKLEAVMILVGDGQTLEAMLLTSRMVQCHCLFPLKTLIQQTVPKLTTKEGS